VTSTYTTWHLNVILSLVSSIHLKTIRTFSSTIPNILMIKLLKTFWIYIYIYIYIYICHKCYSFIFNWKYVFYRVQYITIFCTKTTLRYMLYIFVNIFIMSSVSKNEYSAACIFIFHFCLMNLRVNHKFTALVFESVSCGLQLTSFGMMYST